MARRKKNKIKLSSKLIATLLVIVMLVAIALVCWYLVAPTSFLDTLEKVKALFEAPALSGGGTEGNPTGALLKIHFVDVGQGDAIYLQFPDGKDMLIDAGDKKSENTNRLLNYLNSYGDVQNGIDYLMLTHVDADHVGGMNEVLESYTVSNIYMPNIGTKASDPEVGFWDTVAYEEFYEAVQIENATVKYNEGNFKIEGADYKVDVYCPDASYYTHFDDSCDGSEEKNNMSPVCVIEYAGVRTLLSGDLNDKVSSSEKEFVWSEELFIESTGLSLMDCNVIKAGHHGSRGSTGEALLNFTKPEHIVISVGEGNSYNHPHVELIDRINEYNSELSDNIYRTDEKGHILMNIGSNGEYNFQWEKNS